MPTLSIQLAGLPPVSHILKDETITIGRMKGNTIVIENSSISLMHAKITRKNGDFLLKDLNSTNGTIVNGQPIGEIRLRDMDRVRFAEITCQFVADAAVPGDSSVRTQQISIPSHSAAPLQTAAQPPTVAAPLPVIAAPVAAATVAAAPKNAPRKRANRSSLFVLRLAIPLVILGMFSFVGWRVYEANQESLQRLKARGSTPAVANPSAALSEKPQLSEAKTFQTPKTKPESANNAPDTSSTEPWVPKSFTQQKTQSTMQKEGVAQLIQALKNEDSAERQRAAAALHSLGGEAKEAIPALREALKDIDQDVQMWAALALVNNQEFDKGVVPVLVRVLRNDNPVLRQVACLSLGLIPYVDSEKESVIPALTETAGKDANDDVRKAALSALSIIAPDTVGKTALK